MQQKSITQFILIGTLCLLLAACGARNGVVFDSGKAHHGDGEFVSVKQGSFFGHFMMRLREDDPPARDPEEIKSIVGVADRQLLGTYAAQPRVTWIGHATSLVQYQGISYLTDPHLTQLPVLLRGLCRAPLYAARARFRADAGGRLCRDLA